MPCTRHCNPSLQASLETAQAQTAAAKHEAEFALKEKDIMLQHQMAEAAKAATAAEEGAAADIAKIEQQLAESRVTVQWLEIEVGPDTSPTLTASRGLWAPLILRSPQSPILCAEQS